MDLHTKAKKHHKKGDASVARPQYRDSRRERAVKVYTINQESRYLLIQGVPEVGASEELIQLCSLYGTIEEYLPLDEYPCEKFTEVYLVKFQKLSAAKLAKQKLDDKSFMGSILHICYAPEFESIEDTKSKLDERLAVVQSSLSSRRKSGSTLEKAKTAAASPVSVPTVPEKAEVEQSGTTDSSKSTGSACEGRNVCTHNEHTKKSASASFSQTAPEKRRGCKRKRI
eukprot:m.40130 g.40130  ORF g.40130 m.40130 type:complete len:227 (+) comp32907_c0_seq3:19-699(+)